MRHVPVAITVGFTALLAACGSGGTGGTGRIVAVVRGLLESPDHEGLYGYDREGRFVRRVSGSLAQGWGASSPEWSPDRSRLAFVDDKAGLDFDQLFVADVDGGGDPVALTAVPDAPFAISIESWSPDGTRIAFYADLDEDGRSDLCVVPSAGGTAEPLSDAGTYVYYATTSWSPDGRYFSWCESDTADGPLRRMVADLVLHTTTNVSGPMVAGGGVWPEQGVSPWAPDGSRLLFLADKEVDEQEDLYSVLPDGTGLAKLSTDLAASEDVWSEEWSSDSAWVAYRASTASTARVATVAAAGGTVTTQSAAGDRVAELHWRPGADEVAWSATDTLANARVLRIRAVGAGGATTLFSSPGLAVALGSFWRWSPDGARVAFRLGDPDAQDPHMGLWSVALAAPGSAEDVVPTLTATGNVDEFGFQWSPDGTRLLVEAREDDASPVQAFLWTAGGGTVQASHVPSGQGGVFGVHFTSTGGETTWVEGWDAPDETAIVAGPSADDPRVAVAPGPEIDGMSAR